MALTQKIRTGWRQFLAQLTPLEHDKLLAWLRDCYREEVHDEAQFRRHAEHMYYPQFRERLQQIAREEQAHIRWLREQILALGGQPPAVAPPFKAGGNNWHNLLLDLDEEKQSSATLLEGIRLAAHVDSDIVAGLERIRQEEQRHQEEIRHILVKSEPDAVRIPEPADAEALQQKQEWLEHQKRVWLERQRAAWEADGKPLPWAEWEGEQEFKWATELPHYELRWAQRLAARANPTLAKSDESALNS